MKTKTICVLDTKSSNLKSLLNMISHTGHNFVVSNETRALKNADSIIIPGVGSFSKVMSNLLNQIDINVLENEVKNVGKPTLGICVGMQIMNRVGYENGKFEGLNWFSGSVKKFENVLVPHVGWNTVAFQKIENSLSGDFYFTHSYKVIDLPDPNILGITKYGPEFVSAQVSDNIIGVQFHPEKSQSKGLKFMKYFFSI